MTFKTRIFGKKLKEPELRGLLSALGQDDHPALRESIGGWTRAKTWGRVSFNPEEDGVGVDLYLFKRTIHVSDGSLQDIESNGFGMSHSSGHVTTNVNDYHLEGKIPYQTEKSQDVS